MIQFNYKLRKQKVCFKEVEDSPQTAFSPARSISRENETKEKNRRDATSAFQFLPPPCLPKTARGSTAT